jgi:SAM-dependent methyltransferase
MDTYEKYIGQYKIYHAAHQPGRSSGYSGRSILKQLRSISAFAKSIGAQTALDYGCGRGEQYTWNDIDFGDGRKGTLLERFGLNSITLFDPAVPEHMMKPMGRFDLVICTDVLEHVHENDVARVLSDIFSFAERGVFLSIACYKAGTVLANGENAHITVRGKNWWRKQIEAARGASVVQVHAVFKYKIKFHKRFKLKWERALAL